MTWTIQLFAELGFVEVSYTGLVTYSDRIVAKAELAEKLELAQKFDGTSIRRVIVTFKGANAPEENVGELRSFLDDLATTDFLRGKKIAYVTAPMEHETASRSMARLVGYEFGAFRERPLALDWLLQ